MKLTMAEAGGEDLEGKALVMRVVLNRVLDPEFPSTVEGVICQSGQFSPLSDGRYFDMIPDDDCHIALAMVQGGWDESYGATAPTQLPPRGTQKPSQRCSHTEGIHFTAVEEGGLKR